MVYGQISLTSPVFLIKNITLPRFSCNVVEKFSFLGNFFVEKD